MTGDGAPSKEGTSHSPNLSVVVPVYNARELLEKCLLALAASDYHDFEVLVVDDGSDQPVQELVERFGFKCIRIDGPGGPARARNRGVERVSGKYVVCIDADVCVHTDTLSRFAKVFASDPRIDAVVGSYDETPAEPDFFSQYKNLFHHYVHQKNGETINTFWTGCGAIRRDLLIAFGGFDEQRYRRPAIEDIELGTWLTAAGFRIVLRPEIKAQHLKRWTLWSILKSDVLDRGVPWIQLMLRAGAAAKTLNVKPQQRLSVLLIYCALLALVSGLLVPSALYVSGFAMSAITLINIDFYRYFILHRGLWFALRSVPMHWLYFVYCGVCVAWGTSLHYAAGFNRSSNNTVQHARVER